MTQLVECYSGYAYGERPTALYWEAERLEVVEILARWRTPQGRFFRVRVADRRIFEVCYRESCYEWYVTPLQNP
jgi:hypothetical protein